MSETKRQDSELYEKYMQTRSPRDLHKLVTQLQPLIYTEVQRASGSLPTQALAGEAKSWAIHAIHTYDPSKGTMLSTHVMNYLQKTRRMNYKFQNVARLSENNQLNFHKYSASVQNLQERLNRDPSDDEIAAELGWTKKAVVKFKGGIFQDIAESSQERASEVTRFDSSKVLFHHLMDTLTPEEKIIMESLDMNMSASQLADKLGVNINRYNYLKGKLVKKIQAAQHEMVPYV